MLADFRFFITESALRKLSDPKFTGEGKAMNLFAFPKNYGFEDRLMHEGELLKEVTVNSGFYETPSLFESQKKKPIGLNS